MRPSSARSQSSATEGLRIPQSECWFWGLCIFLLTNPFYFNLTGSDPTAVVVRDLTTMRRAAEGSQLALYAIRVSIAAVAVAFASLNWRPAIRAVPRLAPMLAFVAWASASMIWSDSFESTLHGLFALAPLIIAGFCMATRLPPKYLARSMLYSGAFMALFSIIWVVLLPRYGVHQASDASQSVHAGAWRGVYIHKNGLGQTAAIYAAMTIVSGSAVIRSLAARALLFLVMVVIVLKSDSASAFAIIALAPVLVAATVMLNPAQRTLAFLVVLGPTLALIMALPSLLALLGRDMTFTGRDRIWSIAFDSISQRPLTGYGFMSPTYGDFARLVHQQVGVFDPHSGFLDLVLAQGVVGLALFLIAIFFTWRSARQMYLAGGAHRQAALMLFAGTVGWLIAMMTESDDRPLTSVAVVGFMTMSILTYATPKVAEPRRRLLGMRFRRGAPHRGDGAPVKGRGLLQRAPRPS